MRPLPVVLLALVAGFFLWWGVLRDAPPSSADDSPTVEARSAPQPSPTSRTQRPRAHALPSRHQPSTTPGPNSNHALEPGTFTDTRLPLKKRREMLEALAHRGDEASISLLMTVGSGRAYLRWAAVAALGRVRDPRRREAIARYLEGKLGDADSRTAEAAVRAYGELKGDAGVTTIAKALSRAHARDDGLGSLVARACVEALKRIGTASAAKVLAAELARAVGAKDWDHEYGSEVVKALSGIGGDPARDALLRYIAALEAQLPSDAMARGYLQSKIAEARAAVAGRAT